MRRVAAALLLDGFVFPLRCFPPETLLPGHKPSQDENCFEFFHRVISKPISLNSCKADMLFMPGTANRSTPVKRYNSFLKLKAGAFLLTFFLLNFNLSTEKSFPKVLVEKPDKLFSISLSQA
ncbi:hypothetical protein lpbnt_03151 [Legionella pneumophila]|nr:hypothetical protein lpbnt_03151 [Legionella pneumophila]GAN22059.1 hypothetical protein lpofk_03085 [Legionella pneumophila]